MARPGRWLRQVDPALAGVVALALALRLFQLGHDSFWIDEIRSVFRADGLPFLRSVRETFGPFDPPLGFAIEAAARRLPGLSLEAAARLPMAVAGVAEVALAWVLLRRFFHRRQEATVAAVLLAVAPFAVRYGQEARYYALASALHLGGWILVLEVVRGRTRAVWWWAAVSVVAVYTTAIAWVLVGAQAAIGLLACRGRRRSWVAASVALVVAFAPWAAYEASYWTGEAVEGNAVSVSRGLTYDVRFDPELWGDVLRWLLGNGSAWVAAPFVAFVVLAPIVGRAAERRAALAALGYVVAVVGAIVVLSRLSGTYFAMRRVEFLVPVLCALAAVGVCGLARRLAGGRPSLRNVALVGSTLLLLGALAPALADYYRSEKSDYRGAARAVVDGEFDLVVLGPLPPGDTVWAPALRRYLRESGVEQRILLLHELGAAPTSGEVAWITTAEPTGAAFEPMLRNRVDRLQVLAGDASLDSFAVPVVAVSASYGSPAELRRQAAQVGVNPIVLDKEGR